jgi:hypothetical protein
MLLLHGDKAPDTASNDGNVGRSISLMHLGVPCHCHSARSLVRFSGQRPPWLIKDERKGFGPTWSIDPPRRCARWWCRPSQILMRVSPRSKSPWWLINPTRVDWFYSFLIMVLAPWCAGARHHRPVPRRPFLVCQQRSRLVDDCQQTKLILSEVCWGEKEQIKDCRLCAFVEWWNNAGSCPANARFAALTYSCYILLDSSTHNL